VLFTSDLVLDKEVTSVSVTDKCFFSDASAATYKAFT